ncbi:PREDICTED: bifunctional epoxide hydrolase 2 [Cyprinodon variegatus]|uniref:bifunctional epoxide hydrolase 2 n=1 Tax=Cyprinodon variegatus TaxID=28743 RepID=UPI000742CC7B|nr:PREDICTED: bifunctional epoxide hydrolase 2 [Cyprinodon variegatus]
MGDKKAVLFNFWGVVVPSRAAVVFQKLEEQHKLPRGFLSRVASQNKGSLLQAEKGKLTLNQMIPAFKAECAKEAKARGVTLPSDWCVNCLLEEARKSMMEVKDVVLKTSASLRCSGRAVGAESPPVTCSPDQVSHGYITIRPGVRTHYVEMGSGPPVLLCHGFPESWYSWRYQIPALAAAGFRVLALDMKGYGESTAPPDIEEYSQEQLCKDLITFMDKMSIPQVTLVGHDWGGALVWTMARYYPERIRAVASLNTPLFPPDPSAPVTEKLKALPIFDYQIYFQKPGVAEAELEKDLERTFKIFFSSSSEAASRPALSTAGVCARGGLFVGLPEQIPRSAMLTEADLQYYVSQFRESGFRGPLNWYRNNQANWKWMCSQPTGKVLVPALMVTAGKDPVLLPALSQGMEDLIPNLSRGHIEDCGHWTQMDKPAETNNILISWLKETHGKAGGVQVAPKL